MPEALRWFVYILLRKAAYILTKKLIQVSANLKGTIWEKAKFKSKGYKKEFYDHFDSVIEKNRPKNYNETHIKTEIPKK